MKKLYLSNTDKKIFGVCGGLAEYCNTDSTIFRLLFILLIFGFGTGLLAYFIMAIAIPKKP